jgi:hypothetical protein
MIYFSIYINSTNQNLIAVRRAMPPNLFWKKSDILEAAKGMAFSKQYCLSDPPIGGERVVLRGQPPKWQSQKRFEAALFFGSFLLGKQKK